MSNRDQPGEGDLSLELPLPRITPQIEAIADRVSQLVALLSESKPASGPETGVAAAFARQLHKERRLRASYFAADLFGEPAWDMLLDLFASDEEAKPISITSACHGAGAPPSTALRYLNAMLELGLIVKHPAPQDRRTTYVTLSEAARDRMALLLGRMMAVRFSGASED